VIEIQREDLPARVPGLEGGREPAAAVIDLTGAGAGQHIVEQHITQAVTVQRDERQ
jgi:hypothetical protein